MFLCPNFETQNCKKMLLKKLSSVLTSRVQLDYTKRRSLTNQGFVVGSLLVVVVKFDIGSA